MTTTNTVAIIQTVTKKGWINMLDHQIIQMLKDKCSNIIEVPTKNKEMVAFQSQSLQSINNKTLVIGIEQERTDAGRGMVRGLWHDKPVIVWLCSGRKTLRLVALPYKCHIVGPVFSRIYNEVKLENLYAEVSVVWELLVEDFKITDECPPEPVIQVQDGEYEYHLDHPSFFEV